VIAARASAGGASAKSVGEWVNLRLRLGDRIDRVAVGHIQRRWSRSSRQVKVTVSRRGRSHGVQIAIDPD
jgi:uncharacterized Zn finger protein